MNVVLEEISRRKVVRFNMLVDNINLHISHLEREITRLDQLANSLLTVDELGKMCQGLHLDTLQRWQDVSQHSLNSVRIMADLYANVTNATRSILRRLEDE